MLIAWAKGKIDWLGLGTSEGAEALGKSLAQYASHAMRTSFCNPIVEPLRSRSHPALQLTLILRCGERFLAVKRLPPARPICLCNLVPKGSM